MARNLDHFLLPEWSQPLPRRKQGRGRPVHRDTATHGEALMQQVTEISGKLQQRIATAPRGINPKLIFKLELHPKGNLDEESIGRLGLRLLAREPGRAIVVFPDEPALEKLRGVLLQYAGQVPRGHEYAFISSIERVVELSASDRTGRRLQTNPLGPDEVAPLDVEVWHDDDYGEGEQRVREIRALLESRNLRVTDWYIGASICLLRAKVNNSALQVLLGIDYVKEIDRRPQPTFEMLQVAMAEISDIKIASTVPDDLVGVLVVDSGIMQAHPVLGPAIGDAQVFPDSLRQRVSGGPEDGDEATGGHGTAVGGIAAFHDIGLCLKERDFTPSARLFSARVTDEDNKYDEDELIEHQLTEAVEYFIGNYPTVKVINLSLGDDQLVYSDGSYQFRLAAAVDQLAYRYRDRNIVFVVSAGNFLPSRLDGEEVRAKYPDYLLNSDQSRVIDPATSAIAITVGGLSYGAGEDLRGLSESGTEHLVAGERCWPSPFTRTGWGVDGAIKPEVTDFAGDLRFERGRIVGVGSASYAGLPTTAKNFAPPTGRLFRTVAGTSFSAPRVSNLAARLFREFPNASSNLIRALIAMSARVPESLPKLACGRDWTEEEILRLYGYGQPDFAGARWSSQNEVLLLAEASLELDSFRLYVIPSLPREFLTAKGSGRLSVALAFDPPTRHTRGDSYLGVTMQFGLFRNVQPDALADAIRMWSKGEKGQLDGGTPPTLDTIHSDTDFPFRIDMQPGLRRRNKGTLQVGRCRVSSQGWRYDGGPLVLAVVCQRKWAPVDVTHQRFAVIGSLSHESSAVDLYTAIQQFARIYQRVQIRV